MNNKKCYLPTVGSKCVADVDQKERNEVCRFAPLFYTVDVKVEGDDPSSYTCNADTSWQTLDKCPSETTLPDLCYSAMETVSKDQMVKDVTYCIQEINDIKIAADNPYFHVCRAKCTFLISIGEFIERHLHIPGQSSDYRDYFTKIYCPPLENNKLEKEEDLLQKCIDQMITFYQDFYLHLEKPCYAGCMTDCIEKEGPPEFKYNNTPGKFTHDIYHHIYFLP